MEIGFNGDRCWWSACDGASGLTEIGGLERCCGACDGCGVDGVLALVPLGFDRERKKKKEEEEKKEETAEIKEKDVLEKETVGKIILKKEYKNIIYIKYLV